MLAWFSIPFNFLSNMTMFLKSYTLPFDPTPWSWWKGSAGKIVCICDSLKFGMQHDHVLKMLNISPFDPQVRGRSRGSIFATMLLHSWFPLI